MKSQTKQFRVLAVTREDLFYAGFESKNASDRQMRKIALDIKEEIEEFPFFECIRRSANALNIPKLGTTVAYERDFNKLLNTHLDEIADHGERTAKTWFCSPLTFVSEIRSGILRSDRDWTTKEVSHKWNLENPWKDLR